VTSTVSTYQHSLTAAVAFEHLGDLLRAADASRVAALLPERNGHRTARRRPTWWLSVLTRSTTPRTA
jgi:hypothetical protein